MWAGFRCADDKIHVGLDSVTYLFPIDGEVLSKISSAKKYAILFVFISLPCIFFILLAFIMHVTNKAVYKLA